MKVFLAGCENTPHWEIALASGIKNCLISYYHAKKSDDQIELTRSLLLKTDEVICDSGLFTLMFGAGKGQSHDLASMHKYVDEYLTYARKIDMGNVTFVEADVHKLLGMPAVFELRKRFEDSGLKVLYTWHVEEGIDGLHRMAEKYKYIALSVPELRVVFKGKKQRYQDAVKQLLREIYANAKVMPRIHLLGNTVQETMETRYAYSCDSTSYIAGVKFGVVVIFKDGKLQKCSIRSSEMQNRKRVLQNQLLENGNTNSVMSDYFYTVSVSCDAYKQYQSFLDRNFTFIGDQNGHQD